MCTTYVYAVLGVVILIKTRRYFKPPLKNNHIMLLLEYLRIYR